VKEIEELKTQLNAIELNIQEKMDMINITTRDGRCINAITPSLLKNMIVWYGCGFIPHYVRFLGEINAK
jgi:hypothetical protein